jgi:hypothetical protein
VSNEKEKLLFLAGKKEVVLVVSLEKDITHRQAAN